MMFGSDPRLDELRADYGRLRDAALRAQERMRTATATVTSAKGLVTAVVGAQGDLQSLVFNSRAYRDLPPAELSHVVVDTVRRARDAVMRELLAELPTGLFGDTNADDLRQGRIDVAGLLPEDLPVNGLARPAPPPGRR
jgi:hypothetical protein